MAQAEAALLRAKALLVARRPAEAAEYFSEAERLGADADFCTGSRWTCAMLAGDYELAWEQSDALRARGAADPHRVWNGAPIDGRRVLVRSVHGYGDAVQMLRYMPLLRRRAARLTLQVAPELVPLARCARSVDEVVPWGTEPAFDVQLEITEVPYLLRSTLETLPSTVPYLDLPTHLWEQASHSLGAGRSAHPARLPRVGLVWTSSAWDRTRSIPFRILHPLLEACREVELWCLQPVSTSPEWKQACLLRGWPVRRAGDHSLELFAGCVAQMDLIITIDSFAAHLAGALGRPVWVMLKHQADWRWMVDRSDSPWYPTMQLFRQLVEDDWPGVVERVARELGRSLRHFADFLPQVSLESNNSPIAGRTVEVGK